MIELFNWDTSEFYKSSYNTLREFIDYRSTMFKYKCIIHKTNQESLNDIFLYCYDSMGHMDLIRMKEFILEKSNYIFIIKPKSIYI